MRNGLRRLMAVCCCLVFSLPGFARAETQASPAVQPFAGALSDAAEIRNVESRSPSISIDSRRASGSETLSYDYNLETDAISCTFTLYSASGTFLDEETLYVTPKSRRVRYRVDLDEGVYILEAREYDEMGQQVFELTDTFYFLPNASIVVSPSSHSHGVTIATIHGKKQFDWYPVLNSSMNIISSRYRFRITADSVKNRKEDFKYFNERVIVDETMSERWHVVDAKLLPAGTYTVKVWAYDDGGTELACWMMTLVCQERWTIYDYDLITDLDFTPGEAITRQHAMGEKSETLVAYDAVKPEVPELPMTKLTVGGVTLDADCSGARFSASLAGDTLTLRASGAGVWRIRQSALRTLAKSGIRTLRLIDRDGKTRDLQTDLTFAGRPYALLRAKGLVSKDFLLVSEEDGWRVEADGQIFDLMEDGTLGLRAEEKEGAA